MSMPGLPPPTHPSCSELLATDDDITACTTCWPQWTEDVRLDDSLTSAAYESTPGKLRAFLKTGLALTHMRFGESTEERFREVRNAHLGFWRTSHALPVSWSVIAFSAHYAAAARLAAACAAAMLGGVALVGAVCLGGMPTKAALVSLELSGVEDIFSLDTSGLLTLLTSMQAAPGRLVLLHQGELDKAARAARAQGLVCFEECRPPVLAMPESHIFDLEALAFAQAEAFATIQTKKSQRPPDALYLSAQAAVHARLYDSAMPTALLLTPGCEGFWLHSGLTPEFFRMRQEALGLL